MSDKTTLGGIGWALARWALSDDTGASSCEIAKACLMIPPPAGEGPDHPHDIADLGRCLRLIAHIPEARMGVARLAQASPVWAALDARWDEITATAAQEGDLGSVGWFPRLGFRERYPRTYAILSACHVAGLKASA